MKGGENMAEKLALTVAEASELLNIPLGTMYKLVKRKDFTCGIKVGRKILISKRGLIDWFDKVCSERSGFEYDYGEDPMDQSK